MIISILIVSNVFEIKTKITLIDDISQVIVFLLDKENIDYYKELNDNNEEINFRIIDENNTEINIIHYINHIINNNGNISGIYKLKYQNFSINELEEINLKLSSTVNDKTNILNQVKTNTYIENYIKELNSILKSGIINTVYFKDLNGTGYRGYGTESAENYMSYINIKTRVTRRKDFKVQDFDCDESWNVVNKNFEQYKYKSRKQIFDCSSCVNHCNRVGVTPPPVLNYYEYSLEEVLERYKEVNETAPKVYNQLAYQFTAVELLIRKNNTALKQVEKLIDINNYLKNLELEIYESIKNNTKIGENIISYFEELIEEYVTSNDFYSFLDPDFIKNDTLFLLAEIQLSFLNNINNYCLKRLIISIICILVIVLFVLSYSFISYEIPLPKEESKENINMEKIKEEIKNVIKEKSLKQKTKSEQQQLTQKNVINDGKNVIINEDAKTSNKINIKPIYNTLFCTANKSFNEKDILNVNDKIGNSQLLGLNKFFAQDQNNAKNTAKLESIAEEKEENIFNNNICDQSKVNILKNDIINENNN